MSKPKKVSAHDKAAELLKGGALKKALTEKMKLLPAEQRDHVMVAFNCEREKCLSMEVLLEILFVEDENPSMIQSIPCCPLCQKPMRLGEIRSFLEFWSTELPTEKKALPLGTELGLPDKRDPSELPLACPMQTAVLRFTRVAEVLLGKPTVQHVNDNCLEDECAMWDDKRNCCGLRK